MLGLPEVVYSDKLYKRSQQQFGGYNHNRYAGDGEIWDMKNMSSDHYPLLAPREKRYAAYKIDSPNGFYAKDGIYWVAGTELHREGVLTKIGDLEDSRKIFTSLGSRVVIWPDKVCYDYSSVKPSLEQLAADWSGSATFGDGTYAGEAAAANTIVAEGIDLNTIFRAGDAVLITASGGEASDDVTIVEAIVREAENGELRFYENTFRELIAAEGETPNVVRIRRTVPDLDYICEHGNRLWGVKGDTIYASALGNAFNWNVFDGLSTDSWQTKVGSAGDFTGIVSYRGYVIAFKEDRIYKVYGDEPGEFQLVDYVSLGVEKGSGGSLAIAGEILFYKSRAGIVAYTGSAPQNVAESFGNARYRNAVGCSDGVKYYVSMEDEDGAAQLFVYDTRYGVWHREDDTGAVAFGWNDRLYMLEEKITEDGRSGVIWICGKPRVVEGWYVPEATVTSFAEFGDFTNSEPDKKGLNQIQLRIDMDSGSSVRVLVQFDSCGQWEELKVLECDRKKSFVVPLIPRRCDHYRIRLEGTGFWVLHSMTRQNYYGSAM